MSINVKIMSPFYLCQSFKVAYIIHRTEYTQSRGKKEVREDKALNTKMDLDLSGNPPSLAASLK